MIERYYIPTTTVPPTTSTPCILRVTLERGDYHSVGGYQSEGEGEVFARFNLNGDFYFEWDEYDPGHSSIGLLDLCINRMLEQEQYREVRADDLPASHPIRMP
jgi:hypothetical protein